MSLSGTVHTDWDNILKKSINTLISLEFGTTILLAVGESYKDNQVEGARVEPARLGFPMFGKQSRLNLVLVSTGGTTPPQTCPRAELDEVGGHQGISAAVLEEGASQW